MTEETLNGLLAIGGVIVLIIVGSGVFTLVNWVLGMGRWRR